MNEVIQLLLLIIGVGIGLFNLGCLVSINTYGLNHLYEMFTYNGVSREYYNLNPVGCILVMLIFYITCAPCAVIFWIARLFVREDYFL